jgi:ribonuclease P protein component
MRLILKTGRSVYSDSLQCKYYQDSLTTPRFAIVVPKKTVKKSTERSRIKRLLRSAIICVQKDQHVSLEGVFIVKRLPQELNLTTYVQEITTCHKATIRHK